MREYVVVIGSDMIGNGIGAMSTLAGNKTILVDVEESRVLVGKEWAVSCIRLRQEQGLNIAEEAHRAETLLEASTDTEQTAGSTRMVIGAIIENLQVKQQPFERLDRILPTDMPICSNTSGLRITDISSLCQHPECTVTAYFWLPARLVLLVEVVMGDKMDEQLAVKIRDELGAWRESPVLVRRDLPGQLASRVFQAIIRESIAIVASGLATAEDADTTISCGMTMCFPEWGPLKHLDAIGLDLGLSVQETVLPDVNRDGCANDYLKKLAEDGNLGVKADKGFYDWSKRGIETDMAKRDQFIIEAVKAISRLDQTEAGGENR